MYKHITNEDPYELPMRIYPAIHYTMGGLWVDYHLMTNLPGLFALGECNFSDHGANRLGASALMQGLADGYFIVPYTLANYLANATLPAVSESHDAFKEAENATSQRIDALLRVNGKKTVQEFHRELGRAMWNNVGMARNAKGLAQARTDVSRLREQYHENVRVGGGRDDLNKALEFGGRVADYMEFAEVAVIDAAERDESCGCHFREEHQTEDGECRRNDADYSYVAAWEYTGAGKPPVLHKEPLRFEFVQVKQRSYK
jgi:succinate dehydrogenase / fumarate reductase flavoprotein subunit